MLSPGTPFTQVWKERAARNATNLANFLCKALNMATSNVKLSQLWSVDFYGDIGLLTITNKFSLQTFELSLTAI